MGGLSKIPGSSRILVLIVLNTGLVVRFISVVLCRASSILVVSPGLRAGTWHGLFVL